MGNQGPNPERRYRDPRYRHQGGGGMSGAPPELADAWITGGLATGGLLTANAIPQAQPPTTSYTYQWYSNAVLIVGATSQTYLVVAADSGLPITCAITPVNPMGAGPTTVTPVGVTVPAITHWIDQSASALDYTGAGAAKPKADAGAVLFDATDDLLLAAATAIVPGAGTFFIDFQAMAVPAGVSYQKLMRIVASATEAFLLEFVTGIGGYQPYTWIGRCTVGGALSTGIADAIDTLRHRLIIVDLGGNKADPANYRCTLDAVVKTPIASGAVGDPNFQNQFGLGTVNASPVALRRYCAGAFNEALSVANTAALATLLATGAATTAQLQALGTAPANLVDYVAPGTGWS